MVFMYRWLSKILLLALSTQVHAQAAPAALQADNGELSIEAIHQRMDAGTLSSEALLQFYLQRIERFDDHGARLNAVVQISSQAKNAAIAHDRQAAGASLGLLHGIPVLLKDNIDTADGLANTAGSLALAHNYPRQDAFLVQQLKAAGAIILGKTNLSEWANFRSNYASSGWSGLYGQTANPYDTSTSPCGSSSGSAAAIAANFASVAVGTETDGSVICPAAVNGIVGIKPTLGTISRQGIIPLAHSQDTAGAMGRTVSDATRLLQAMVAVDSHDADTLVSTIDYLSHLKKHGLTGKRIGIVRNLAGYHPGLDHVFEQAIIDIKAQGAIIIEQANIETLGQWNDAEYEVLLYEFKHDINAYLANTAEGIVKNLAQLIEFNRQHRSTEMPYFGQDIFIKAQTKSDLSSPAYLQALKLSKTLSQAKGIDAVIKKHQLDLLIAPSGQPAWKTDWVNGDHYLGSASSPAAVAGYPHITVPMGFVQGLPVGLSMFAGKLQEGILIEAAYAYEQASHRRRPPLLQ